MKRYLFSLLLSAAATAFVFVAVLIGCMLRGQSFEQVMGFPLGWPLVVFVFLSAWFYALLCGYPLRRKL